MENLQFFFGMLPSTREKIDDFSRLVLNAPNFVNWQKLSFFSIGAQINVFFLLEIVRLPINFLITPMVMVIEIQRFLLLSIEF